MNQKQRRRKSSSTSSGSRMLLFPSSPLSPPQLAALLPPLFLFFVLFLLLGGQCSVFAFHQPHQQDDFISRQRKGQQQEMKGANLDADLLFPLFFDDSLERNELGMGLDLVANVRGNPEAMEREKEMLLKEKMEEDNSTRSSSRTLETSLTRSPFVGRDDGKREKEDEPHNLRQQQKNGTTVNPLATEWHTTRAPAMPVTGIVLTGPPQQNPPVAVHLPNGNGTTIATTTTTTTMALQTVIAGPENNTSMHGANATSSQRNQNAGFPSSTSSPTRSSISPSLPSLLTTSLNNNRTNNIANAGHHSQQRMLQLCCPRGGVWGNWTAEGQCTDSCGGCGVQAFRRDCLSAVWGCPCSGNSVETRECAHSPCPFPRLSCCHERKPKASGGRQRQVLCGMPLDPPTNSPPPDCLCCPNGGIWGEWNSQGPCSDNCGSCGVLSYRRECISAFWGCPCSGEASMDLKCAQSPCRFPRPSCCKKMRPQKAISSRNIICGKEVKLARYPLQKQC